MTSLKEREKQILETSKTIAIVGISTDEMKASNIVAQYMQLKGYTIIPVNPNYSEVLGKKCYASLSDIPGSVDIVDIFMRPDRLLPVVEEAVQLRPKCIWLQLGIVNEKAKRLTEAAGIEFFMDSCIKQEYGKIFS